MQQQVIPRVNRVEAENFAKAWTHRGIAIPIGDAHLDFATDFANVVLRSFIMECQRQMEAAMQAAKAAEEPKSSLIIGG